MNISNCLSFTVAISIFSAQAHSYERTNCERKDSANPKLQVATVLLAASGKESGGLSLGDSDRDRGPAQEPFHAAVSASKSQIENEALKLLVYASILSAKTGDAIEVTPEVEKRYNNIRNSIFASLPMAVVMGSVGYSGKKLANVFESSVQPITALIRMIAALVGQSAHAVWDSSEAIHLDRAFIASSRAIKDSYTLVEPIIKIFVSKGSGLSAVSAFGTGTLAASSFLVFNPRAQEAMSIAAVRNLLGYDQQLQKSVDRITNDLSSIFSLDTTKQNIFKEALINEIASQAMKNRYDRKADYQVNVVKILSDKQLITPAQTAAAVSLQAMVQAASQHVMTQLSDQEVLARDLDAVAALCAVLENMVESGKLKETDEKEARQILGNASRNLKLVKLNFQRVSGN